MSHGPIRRLSVILAALLLITTVSQVSFEDEAEAGIFEIWGQLHGGYLSGTADRFDEGSQGFFGFAAGVSITVLDVFMDVRMDGFGGDNGIAEAGMWNQVGVGASFSVPIPGVEPFFGARVGYLYAQYSKAARDAYQEKLAAGERSDSPGNKGVNFSAQAGLDIELVGPLYLTFMADVGYHILLPDVGESNGVNFSGLGGLKLSLGI